MFEAGFTLFVDVTVGNWVEGVDEPPHHVVDEDGALLRVFVGLN